jgi:hypothetical protein
MEAIIAALLAFHQVAIADFHDGFLVGAAIAVPLTLLAEHWLLRPLVRWHIRLSRQSRGG